MVDLVVLACVLRVTTKKRKKGHQLFCIAHHPPPQYFPLELPLAIKAENAFLHFPVEKRIWWQ